MFPDPTVAATRENTDPKSPPALKTFFPKLKVEFN
jgi:hypothetical protein